MLSATLTQPRRLSTGPSGSGAWRRRRVRRAGGVRSAPAWSAPANRPLPGGPGAPARHRGVAPIPHFTTLPAALDGNFCQPARRPVTVCHGAGIAQIRPLSASAAPWWFPLGAPGRAPGGPGAVLRCGAVPASNHGTRGRGSTAPVVSGAARHDGLLAHTARNANTSRQASSSTAAPVSRDPAVNPGGPGRGGEAARDGLAVQSARYCFGRIRAQAGAAQGDPVPELADGRGASILEVAHVRRGAVLVGF